MIRVFYIENEVINTDDAELAAQFIASGAEEISSDVFEGNAHWASSANTVKVDGVWQFSKPTESIAQAEQATARRDAELLKLAGVEFEGVMCSATKEDMWGLASVKDWVRAGSSTNFNFDNGNTLTLTPQNIDAFEAVWIPFRASFFQ